MNTARRKHLTHDGLDRRDFVTAYRRLQKTVSFEWAPPEALELYQKILDGCDFYITQCGISDVRNEYKQHVINERYTVLRTFLSGLHIAIGGIKPAPKGPTSAAKRKSLGEAKDRLAALKLIDYLANCLNRYTHRGHQANANLIAGICEDLTPIRTPAHLVSLLSDSISTKLATTNLMEPTEDFSVLHDLVITKEWVEDAVHAFKQKVATPKAMGVIPQPAETTSPEIAPLRPTDPRFVSVSLEQAATCLPNGIQIAAPVSVDLLQAMKAVASGYMNLYKAALKLDKN